MLGDHVDDLVEKTDKLIIARATGSTRQKSPNTQIDHVRLLWSAALRVCPDIFIQVVIEYVYFFTEAHLDYIFGSQNRTKRVKPPRWSGPF